MERDKEQRAGNGAGGRHGNRRAAGYPGGAFPVVARAGARQRRRPQRGAVERAAGGAGLRVRAAEPQLLGGATVRAWLAKDAAGAASILVELRGSAAEKVDVRCRVALKLLKYPESSMMMRMLPEPEVEELLGKDLAETLAPGQVRVVVIPVPADRLPAPPDPESMTLTHGQITVEALGDA
jgi:hypothetical protein